MPNNEPRAFTKAEMRDKLLSTIRSYAQYWATVEERSIESKLMGMGFSMLVIFDGGATNLPAFELVPTPHESDEEYHREKGENWWPAPKGEDRDLVVSFGIHEGHQLHEMFHQAEPETFYIWWTSQADTEAIGDTLDARFPPYLQTEYMSRLGRPGRGRLWVSSELKGAPQDIGRGPMSAITRAIEISSMAGIVIRSIDARLLGDFPGLLTTTSYERVEIEAQPRK